MSFRAIIATAGILSLSACMSDQEQMQTFQSKCDAYGFKPGTDAYASCLLTQDQQQGAKDFARSQRAVANGNDMMMGQGVWAVE